MPVHLRRRPARGREDHGFTLVEVLVTMALSTIVLFAILGAFDVFSRTSASATNLVTSQESARATLRDMSDALRQSRLPAGETTPIQHTPTGSTGDLVAASWVDDTSGVQQAGWVRYCVSGSSLLFGRRIGETWAGAGAPGPCAPTTGTDPAAGWVYAKAIDGALANSSVFDFTSDSCFGGTGTACPPLAADVRSVGIRLGITDGAGRPAARGTTLYGAVSLRNRG